MTVDTATRPVDELADRFWQGFLERQPVIATILGFDAHDDRLPDPGPAGRAAERAANAETLERARGTDRSELSTEEAVTLDLLEVIAQTGLELDDARLYQLAAVDQLFGAQQIPSDLTKLQKIDTAERFDRFLGRLSRYPEFIETVTGVMAEGKAERRTSARVVVERVIAQVERLLETAPEESAIYTAMTPPRLEDRERLLDAIRRDVYPAYERYLAALRDYLPAAREEIGIWATPDGESAYRASIRAATSLNEEPHDLHAYGLAQIQAINEERAVIAARLGRRSWRDLLNDLDEDPANHATEPQQLVARAETQILKAQAAAPSYFSRLPVSPCTVQAVEPYREKDAPFAFYYAPDKDRSRPGIYFVNTYDLPQRPYHMLATTTYHEAVPGHHFQIALEQELEELSEFRRFGSRMAGTAFVEGWGLYSERLADEIGLYEDDVERIGMLGAQAWRAARLVVDTGIHALHWTRDQSVQFLTDSGLTPINAAIETDRYIAWPGQALAYMVGQREILRLREAIAERDGPRFDLRNFHDQTIGHGSLSLDTLRRELPRWVRPRED
jgi:uncharacterized protein (DUF885 family)